jgi:hypothetical protein
MITSEQADGMINEVVLTLFFSKDRPKSKSSALPARARRACFGSLSDGITTFEGLKAWKSAYQRNGDRIPDRPFAPGRGFTGISRPSRPEHCRQDDPAIGELKVRHAARSVRLPGSPAGAVVVWKTTATGIQPQRSAFVKHSRHPPQAIRDFLAPSKKPWIKSTQTHLAGTTCWSNEAHPTGPGRQVHAQICRRRRQ